MCNDLVGNSVSAGPYWEALPLHVLLTQPSRSAVQQMMQAPDQPPSREIWPAKGHCNGVDMSAELEQLRLSIARGNLPSGRKSQ